MLQHSWVASDINHDGWACATIDRPYLIKALRDIAIEYMRGTAGLCMPQPDRGEINYCD